MKISQWSKTCFMEWMKPMENNHVIHSNRIHNSSTVYNVIISETAIENEKKKTVEFVCSLLVSVHIKIHFVLKVFALNYYEVIIIDVLFSWRIHKYFKNIFCVVWNRSFHLLFEMKYMLTFYIITTISVIDRY